MPRKRTDTRKNAPHGLFADVVPQIPPRVADHTDQTYIEEQKINANTSDSTPVALLDLTIYLHKTVGKCSGTNQDDYYDLRPVVFLPSHIRIEGDLIKLKFAQDTSHTEPHYYLYGIPITCRCSTTTGIGLSRILFAQSQNKVLVSFEFLHRSRLKSIVKSLAITGVASDNPLCRALSDKLYSPAVKRSEDIRCSSQLQESLRGQTVYPAQILGIVRNGQAELFRVIEVNGERSDVWTESELFRVPKDGAYFLTVTSEAQQLPRKMVQPAEDIDQIHSVLERHLMFPLLNPWCFFTEPGKDQLKRVAPPKGFLLQGPPGTGKTFTLRAVKKGLFSRWDEAEGKRYGWSMPHVAEVDVASVVKLGAEHLVDVFNTAREKFEKGCSMALIIIDEIDAICVDRKEAQPGTAQLTTLLLSMLDGVDSHPGVLVLATTNRPNALDEAVRRPGRLDREIEISVPNPEQRGRILLSIINRTKSNVTFTGGLSEATEIARRAHGFVASDILAWVHKAIQMVQEEVLDGENTMDFSEYLKNSLEFISPSALKELMIEIPKTSWDDIGGYDNVKTALKESVEWPIKYWREFERLKLSPPRGILLYGPPGNSKTIMAKAVASESSMNFIAVKGPEIFSKWVGESERMIRTIFRKARQHAPSVIFFDEVDALGGDRQNSRNGGNAGGVQARVLSQMLNEMSGMEEGRQVVVIGATNRPDLLDAALLRPGRFDRLIYVSLPDELARQRIFKIHLRQVHLNDEEVLIKSVAKRSEGYSGAEIAMMCAEVRMDKIRRWLKDGQAIGECQMEIDIADFSPIFDRIKPRTPPDLLEFYENYSQRREK